MISKTKGSNSVMGARYDDGADFRVYLTLCDAIRKT